MDAQELTELLVYLADVATTLKTFLDVYPPAVRGLVQAGFLEYLVMFYESVVPVLTKEWLTLKTTSAELVFSLSMVFGTEVYSGGGGCIF